MAFEYGNQDGGSVWTVGWDAQASWGCLHRKGTMFLTDSGIAVSITAGPLNVWCGFVSVCIFNIEVDNGI